MLVKNWMSRPVVTISPKAGMLKARALMNRKNIRALAVVEDDRLMGLLTDRDLKRSEASDATTLDVYELAYLLEKLSVKKIMVKNPVTIEFDATISEAADLFLKNHLEAAPVMVGGDELVGMLTHADLSRALLSMTAFGSRGVEFGIRIPDVQGRVMEIIAAVRNFGARIASLITIDSQTGEQTREAYLRIYNINRGKLPTLVEQLRQKGTLLYLIDLRTNNRQIFEP